MAWDLPDQHSPGGIKCETHMEVRISSSQILKSQKKQMKLILRIYSIYPNTCKILSFQHAAPAPFLGLRSQMGLLAVVQGGAFRRHYDVLIRV